MNMLKNRTYNWWQIGPLKLAVLCVGIVIGAYWPAIFLPCAVFLVGVSVVLGIYLALAWFKQ